MPAQPDIGAFAQRIYDIIKPLAWEDDAHGWALAYFLAAGGVMSQQIDTYAADGPNGEPGWSILVDVERCPPEALPWLAQFVGPPPVEGMTEQQQRDYIADLANWKRGTREGVIAAVRSTLTGSKSVLFHERVGGAAYQLGITTYLFETPVEDWPATNLALNGGFESNTATWVASGAGNAATLDRIGVPAPTTPGAWAGRLTSNVAALSWANTDFLNVTAGENYTASMFMKRAVGARQGGIQLSWYTAANAFISQLNSPQALRGTTQYDRVSLTGVAPATAAKAVIYLIMQGGVEAVNDQYYFDGVQLENNPAASPYIETDGAIASRASGFGPVGAILRDRQKPAGIVLTYSVLPGQDFQSLLDNHPTFQNVLDDYATFDDVRLDTP